MEILKVPEIMVFMSIAIAVIGVVIGGGAFLWKIQRAFAADISGLRKEVKDDISGFREEVKNDISGLRKEVKDDISGLRKEVKDDISGLRNGVNSLSQRIAKIEGLLMPTPNVTHPQSSE